MKKIYILFVLGILNFPSTFAQDKKQSFLAKHPFVNMTEVGVSLGRTKYNSYGYGYYQPIRGEQFQVQRSTNFTAQTFNGVYLNKKTAVGLTLGVDTYGATVLMPISAGIRRNLAQKKQGGSIFIGSLDAGYTTTWLNEDITNYKTKGGIVISPAIGYKFPMKNGSAWLLNFGYRYQRSEYKQARTGDIYWSESNEVRNYRRITMRLGFEF
jgi:hypothetical protein